MHKVKIIFKSVFNNLKFKILQTIRSSTKIFSDIQIYSIRGHNILFNKLSDFGKAKYFTKRDNLWEYEISKFKDQPITLIELGVHKGYSINKFCEFNKNKDSRFYALDSFLGLPEDWTVNAKKGHFSTNGEVPKIIDSRVEIIKGWVQDTLPELLDREDIKKAKNLVVNYDLDIYSATLFSLNTIHKLKKTYLAFCDELLSQEICALYDYLNSTGSKATLISYTSSKTTFPFQSSFIIESNLNYRPDIKRLYVQN